MSEQRVELVKDVYGAFARGDVPAVLGAFADDIEWYEAEGMPYGGLRVAACAAGSLPAGMARPSSGAGHTFPTFTFVHNPTAIASRFWRWPDARTRARGGRSARERHVRIRSAEATERSRTMAHLI